MPDITDKPKDWRRAWFERKAQDPAWLEAQRARRREQDAKRMLSEGEIAKRNAKARKSYAKHRERRVEEARAARERDAGDPIKAAVIKKKRSDYNRTAAGKARGARWYRKNGVRRARERRVNPIERLKKNLRGCINRTITRRHRFGEFRNMVGCTGNELRAHLESQFLPWMTWGNYGVRWEIDHIAPLSYFDLSKREEVLRANHFLNLRPLEKSKNRSKCNRAGWQQTVLPLQLA